MSSADLLAQAASAPPEVAESLYQLARGEAVKEAIRSCVRCPLHESRRNAVPFSGQPGPIAFVGEAPGANEDREGVPFIGASGRLLDTVLSSLSLARWQFPILNTIACRPPSNNYQRAVDLDAPNRCRVHFDAQLAYLGSWCLVLFGAKAISRYIDSSVSNARKAGPRWVGEFYVIPTYHPAYALRNPGAQHEIAKDLSILPAILAGEYETPFPPGYDPTASLLKFNPSLDPATLERRFRIDGYVVLFVKALNDTVVVTRSQSIIPMRHYTLPRYTLDEILRLVHLPNQAMLRRVHLLKRELGATVAS